MKNLILFLVTLFITCSISAQIIDIPDANFKYELVNNNVVDTDNNGFGDATADTNSDGEIDVSEAEAITNLNIQAHQTLQISSLEGIEYFINLEVLHCDWQELTELDLSNSPNLKYLNCYNNQLTDLNISSNLNLEYLDCESNNLISLDLSGFTNLIELNCKSNALTSLILSNNTSLTTIDCSFNSLNNLITDGLTNLTELNCGRNELTTLSVTNNNSLETLASSYNQLTNIDVSDLTSLTSLYCNNNQLTSLDVSDLASLTTLECNNNQLTSLDATALTQLRYLRCQNNLLANLNITNLQNLITIDCDNNHLTSLDLNSVDATRLICSNNQLTSIDISTMIDLTILHCDNNLLTSIDFGAINLEYLYCSNNQFTNLDVSSFTNLVGLDCSYNELTDLNIINFPNLNWVDCSNNLLTSLDVTNEQLERLVCSNNLLTNIDVSNIPSLFSLYCNNNLLTNLDISNSTIYNLDCSNNELVSLNIKNGVFNYNYDEEYGSSFLLEFNNNPNLEFICSDLRVPDYFGSVHVVSELDIVQNLIDVYGYTNCAASSYCSFVPGGTFYTIEGATHLDLDANGCDVADTMFTHLNFNITGGTDSGNYIADSSGNYTIPVQDGSHTITPTLENPDYFIVSPSSVTVSFPTSSSPFIQDFCISPNGVFNDLEITIIPIELARPGFDTNYKVVYKNKGTTALSGNINFGFEDDVMDFVSAIPNEDSQSANLLTWNFADLAPFESREINLTMNLNAPTDTPPLNDGDLLTFNTSIASSDTDETPDDNMFELNQTVVNSFDPNDKTCLEGAFITPEMVGDYVHYMIRFENTGSADAINIVVKDHIDITKYDLSSLVPLHASHNYFANIKDDAPDHYVEFIFEAINLPFDDANNDGYVVFKIKTLNTLELNDTIENEAEIYFDFNFPIITNIAETTVQVLSVDDFEFDANISIYPNPVQNELFISSKEVIEYIRIYDVSGRLIREKSSIGSQMETSISTERLSASVYFIKVKTAQNEFTKRVVKQ